MKARVLELVLEGKKDSEVAAAVSTHRVTVSRQAIAAFRKRHAGELVQAAEIVVREAVEFAIGQKLTRIEKKNERWQLLQRVIEERAADGASNWEGVPGMATGLLVHTEKSIGGGENAQVVDEFEVDRSVLQELLALEESAAEELGQKPRPDTRVHIDARTQVLVREYVGFDPRTIG